MTHSFLRTTMAVSNSFLSSIEKSFMRRGNGLSMVSIVCVTSRVLVCVCVCVQIQLEQIRSQESEVRCMTSRVMTCVCLCV